MTIIDGKTIAQKIHEEVKQRTTALKFKGITPCLAVLLVGNDPASFSYVKGKEKALAEDGMDSRDVRLPADTTQDVLLDLIDSLNADKTVHGILVQLPLPQHINESLIIEAIAPEKDVDGFHPVSVGNMVLCRKGFLPCTPNGVIYMLKELNSSFAVQLNGAHAVIVGRSNIVGRPLAILLSQKTVNATVTICHTGTRNLPEITRQADILIVAAGKPALVTGSMVRDGATVIDVGVNRVADSAAKKGYHLCGDVDFDSVAKKAAFITPVPGGVGPLTIAMLLRNVVDAAETRSGFGK
ncbi:MAG: bifunctional 5,10-methylene-tetrahydrofolate dehydrogenase/5,10-methylene-tetrahydrofolate cyclohydrolase [Treponema sp.]|jgi:methylenetetrahydrofolate dehydrogenase (NADP+)/methenyltetrahydrofolate cyclohydrolase|nr:bifunctional 5,10-methylene-tetrahydrofolate dehydrogenase/5,10-methylene-tetrahydrofolate cyclohydrolase [Treponema sp.]